MNCRVSVKADKDGHQFEGVRGSLLLHAQCIRYQRGQCDSEAFEVQKAVANIPPSEAEEAEQGCYNRQNEDGHPQFVLIWFKDLSVIFAETIAEIYLIVIFL